MARELRHMAASEGFEGEMCVDLGTTTTCNRRLFGRLIAEERGVELVEAALVFPLLFMLLIGLIWMGMAFSTYQTATRAAREGARLALAPNCSTCTNPGAFPSDTDVQAVINNALSARGLDQTKVNPAISISRNQVLNPSDPAANQVPGVIITFGYPVQLNIPFTQLNATTITITTQVQMRQEF